MGKNKKKKDPEKKALQRAAKADKQDKKAARKLVKENTRSSSASTTAGGAEGAAASGGGGGGGGKGGDNRDNNSDIDAILNAYARRNRELTTPVVEILGASTSSGGGDNDGSDSSSPFPYPPRGNFTLTSVPATNELVLFGGEYYDGAENVVFDELYRWDPDGRQEEEVNDDDDGRGGAEGREEIGGAAANPGLWRRITSPSPTPPARCSHTTVHYNNALYVFGGELATTDKYHHYKDLWKFDLKTNLWTEIKPRGGLAPPSRSGHRALVWRHYMVVFGGFYEALRETRWYRDLWLYDLSTDSWKEMVYSKLATTPPARSAFNLCLGSAGAGGDTAYVSGGYSKLKNPAPGSRSEAQVHNDTWALNLKGVTTGKVPTWDRVSRRGEYPSSRSGTACVPYKGRMLVFGGVSDDEGDHHSLKSVFYDDLFAFDTGRRRWFRMGMKAGKGKGEGKAASRRRRRKDDGGGDDGGDDDDDGGGGGDGQAEDGRGGGGSSSSDDDEDMDGRKEGEAPSSGWDLDMLRANMFAFIDGEGNIVYEKIEPDDDDEREEADGDKEEEGGDADDEEDGKDDDNDNSKAEEPALVDEKDEQGGNDDEETAKEEAKASKGRGATEAVKAGVINDSTAPIPQPPPPSLPPGAGVGTSEVMTVNATSGNPEAVPRDKPLPRINAGTAVRGSTLYVYGGLLEVGDREVTLDDCWSIDLHRRERWVCVWPGSMHRQVWRGVDGDDDESYVSTGVEGSDGSDYDGEERWGVDGAIDEEGGFAGEDDEARKAARKAAKKEAKKEAKRGLRDEIAKLKEKLDLDDADRTPQMGEAMAEFYSRTAQYWEGRAAAAIEAASGTEEGGGGKGSSADPMSVKELKREGFNIARERYEELKPVLDRLNELEAQQREAEGSKKSRTEKGDKKEKSSKEKKKKKKERRK